MPLRRLTTLVNERFASHLEALDPTAPPHRVEFSRRITTSWALIYYRRRLVRLSPYLFLLPETALPHGTHWRELDATLRHEAAHAAAFHAALETSHGPLFHSLLDRLGVERNGCADLGPENRAFRYVYRCPTCAHAWQRRVPLRGNWSCAGCSPGAYSVRHRMQLAESLPPPWSRVLERPERLERAIADAERALASPRAPPLLARR